MTIDNYVRLGAYICVAYATINIYLEKKYILQKRYRSYSHLFKTVFWFEHPDYVLKENVSEKKIDLLKKVNDFGVFVVWLVLFALIFGSILKKYM